MTLDEELEIISMAKLYIEITLGLAALRIRTRPKGNIRAAHIMATLAAIQGIDPMAVYRYSRSPQATIIENMLMKARRAAEGEKENGTGD